MSKIRMSSRRIVEVLEIVANSGRGGLGACVDAGTDQFRLQCAEEALGHGAVPAISFSTHARDEANALEVGAVAFTRDGASAV